MAAGQTPNSRVAEIVSLLRPERSGKLPESLTAAAIAGDIEGMELFQKQGATFGERSVGFASVLGAACAAGQGEAVRWLIAHGAPLDEPDGAASPIQSALGKGYCDIAAILLDAGLPLEKAALGIDVAAITGNEPMLRWLVGRGIDLDRAYPRFGVLRERAMKLAEKNGKHDLAALLRDGAIKGDAASEPPRGKRAEQAPRAAAADRAQLVEEALSLIRSGGPAASRWKSSRPGGSPDELLISYAALFGALEVVQAMLESGAEPDYAPPGTPPPLYNAAAGGHVEIVTLLLDRGASPNGADGKTWLPLVGALMSGNPEIVRMLLAAGAKPKAKPAGGGNITQYIRGPYHAELAELLTQAADSKPHASKVGGSKSKEKKASAK